MAHSPHWRGFLALPINTLLTRPIATAKLSRYSVLEMVWNKPSTRESLLTRKPISEKSVTHHEKSMRQNAQNPRRTPKTAAAYR
jgi:hypothetical protein